MEEKLTEYIQTNSYQTKITEELKNSLNREIFGDLMEFIESVAFIRWLIQPENVRGYASDRPRDEEGKIIVDITKPHILKDMDFFRERALFYKKHGRYTHLRPNPNPKSEYAQFWKEEMRRWKHGVVRESDGEWIPGLFYFYLNYSPIWLNEEESKSLTSKKSKGVRKREFPKVWLGDYLFFHYVNQARQSGAHAKLLKCRGVGFSYKTAAMSPCNMYVEPGLPNFHLASDKTFLDGEKGVYGKVLDVLDWIADTTPLPKMRLVNSPRSREVQLGYQDEYGIKKGLKSSVYGISLKDNPDKARGVRGPLIHYEEDGLFPNLEKAWNVNRKAVEDGDIVYGLMFAGGCLTENNYVWNNVGDLIKISDVNKVNGIIGFNEKTQSFSKEEISYIQDPLYKNCVRITTNTGRFIECSFDHPILWSNQKFGVKKELKSENGKRRRQFSKAVKFKEAINVRVGDQLATIDKVDIFSNKDMWNPRLVGWLIGDGSYGFDKTPVLSNCEPEINDYVYKNFDCAFESGYITKLGKEYKETRIKGITKNLRELGIYGQTKLNKRLPINIHSYSKQSVCEFIGGLFDTDGYVSKTGRISISQANKEILIELLLLLQKLGIHGNILTKNPSKKNPKDKNIYYNLEISDKDSVLRFVENIKLFPKEKQLRLNSFNKLFENRESRNVDHFSGIRFERVVKIEDIGVQRIYNLTADDTHTYIGNGIITHNTGGTENADFEGSEKLFRNPLAYNIHGIPNVFDKNSNGETLCGFFWGAYLNRAKCYDEVNGEPDVIGALIQILEDRYVVKYNSSDPQVVTQKLAEEPITPSEAVMRTGGTIFPVADLKDYRDSIKIQGERYFDAHYVGDLTLTNKGVEWKPNSDIKPIRKFPTGTDKPEGAVEIFEMPKTDYKGKIDPNRYVAGADVYDDDSSQTTSLGSIFIFDLYTDRIVAEYTGRPRFANDFYEICRRLLIFYNAKCNYESNKKGLYAYFDQRRCLHLLCHTPQILRDMDYQKESGYGNKAIGTNASKPVNAWGRMLQRDWLLSSATIQEYDENGEQIGEKLNMHTVRSVPYIEELIAWNSDINADRCVAYDTEIETYSGLKKIQDINIGEYVLTKSGEYNRVKQIHENNFSGDKIKINFLGDFRPLECTWNHPIYIKRNKKKPQGVNWLKYKYDLTDGEYIEAKDVKRGDYVFIPKRTNLKQSWISEDLLYLLGWYVSDGWLCKTSNLLRIFLHESQYEIGLDLVKILNNNFASSNIEVPMRMDKNGRIINSYTIERKNTARIVHSNDSNMWIVELHSKDAKEFLAYHGGTAFNKKLSSEVYNSYGLIPFLKGYFEGDGHYRCEIRSDGVKRSSLELSTVYRELIFQVRQILLDHGIWNTIRLIPYSKRKKNCQDQYSINITGRNSLPIITGSKKFNQDNYDSESQILHIEESAGYLIKVKNISTSVANEIVYNISVETDESYVANGILTHNCSAMGMLMIYREDRLKYLSNKSSDQDPEEIDKYIEENFKNAYDSQNSYVKWQEDTSWD